MKQEKVKTFDDLLGEYALKITDATQAGELAYLADDLWNMYFLDKAIDKAQRKKVMELYNVAANGANKHAGSNIVQLITPSTKWEPKVENETAVPRKTHVPTSEQPAKKTKSKAGKQKSLKIDLPAIIESNTDDLPFIMPGEEMPLAVDMPVTTTGSVKEVKLADLKKGILPTKGTKPAAATNGSAIPQPDAAGGKIQQILALHIVGKTNKEIVEAGFNKSTVNRQVSEYKQRQKANETK